ncbi:MAG: C40 family peptidase [Azoarcus sp.]|jgi:cell wall-associated NlpC family hydrolase|nr:C40 family peptidase [Azoarcus sp.]
MESKTPDNPPQAAVARSEGSSRGSVTVARVARSGPVFGLAVIAAITATRAARSPVPVFTPAELSTHTPVAAVAATNTLLSTAKTTSVGASLLPVVTPTYAAAVTSASKAGLGGLSSARHAMGASAVQKLLGEGLMYIGVPYRWGGISPITGMDCSGLVQVVFRNAVGIDLPRTAIEQATQGNRVSLRELKPGDLVFFNTIGINISHVGIYVGNGKFLHSPTTGKFVRIDKLYSRFWGTRYVTARRMIDDTNTQTPRLIASGEPAASLPN